MQCNCLKYNYLIFRTPHKWFDTIYVQLLLYGPDRPKQFL